MGTQIKLGRPSVITPLIERIVLFLDRENKPVKEIAELVDLSIPTIYKIRNNKRVAV